LFADYALLMFLLSTRLNYNNVMMISFFNDRQQAAMHRQQNSNAHMQLTCGRNISLRIQEEQQSTYPLIHKLEDQC
jgi:hypothetical protein